MKKIIQGVSIILLVITLVLFTAGCIGDDKDGGDITQGCCYKYEGDTCICSAPVFESDCPSGYTWIANKNCYEDDNTGCCDRR